MHGSVGGKLSRPAITRKSLDGVRVARLRGLTDVAKPELGPLDIDLEETAPPKLPRQGHCALPCLTRFSVLQWDWRVRLFYNFLHC